MAARPCARLATAVLLVAGSGAIQADPRFPNSPSALSFAQETATAAPDQLRHHHDGTTTPCDYHNGCREGSLSRPGTAAFPGWCHPGWIRKVNPVTHLHTCEQCPQFTHSNGGMSQTCTKMRCGPSELGPSTVIRDSPQDPRDFYIA